jgi:iron complex transport system substrate-binding protein
VHLRTKTCVIAVAALVLAACGSPSAPEAPPADAPAGAFPVTITHAFGSTTIPARPTRIVALSLEEDVLSQVGVTTVGHADNAYEPGVPYPWQLGKVDLSTSTALDTTSELNIEKVAALQPDLILATNYASLADVYGQLSAIAPTVGYRTGWGEATWQDTSRVIGLAIGKQAEVDRAIDGTEQYLRSLAGELPGLHGKSFSSVYYYDTGLFAVDTNPEGQTARMLGELGLVLSPRIVAEVRDRSLSAEQVGLIDADLVGLGIASDDLKAQLTASPLFQAVPAVRDGRVNVSDNYGATAGNNPTLLDIPWQLDRQRSVLEKVAAA